MSQSEETKQSAATNVLVEVAELVKNSANSVRARLKDVLVERELSGRVDTLDKALTKLSEAKRAMNKFRPDVVTVDAAGAKTETYTEAKYKERVKAQEDLARFEKAVESALAGEGFDKLRELVK